MLTEAQSLTQSHTTTLRRKSGDMRTSGLGPSCVFLPSQFQRVKKKTVYKQLENHHTSPAERLCTAVQRHSEAEALHPYYR